MRPTIFARVSAGWPFVETKWLISSSVSKKSLSGVTVIDFISYLSSKCRVSFTHCAHRSAGNRRARLTVQTKWRQISCELRLLLPRKSENGGDSSLLIPSQCEFFEHDFVQKTGIERHLSRKNERGYSS